MFDRLNKHAQQFVSYFGGALKEFGENGRRLRQRLIVSMPTTIPKPQTIPGKTSTDIEIPKVKNLRFCFKDGQAQLSWEEVGTDAVVAHSMSMSEEGKRRFFVGANWKSNGSAAFVEKFGEEVL